MINNAERYLSDFLWRNPYPVKPKTSTIPGSVRINWFHAKANACGQFSTAFSFGVAKII